MGAPATSDKGVVGGYRRGVVVRKSLELVELVELDDKGGARESLDHEGYGRRRRRCWTIRELLEGVIGDQRGINGAVMDDQGVVARYNAGSRQRCHDQALG